MIEAIVKNAALAPILAASDAEYKNGGVFFLDADYLTRLQAKCNAFPRSIALLVREAQAIAADEEAARYALFLCRNLFECFIYLL